MQKFKYTIKKDKNAHSGQVILETAIVFVSIAVIAISSMALFSNLNLNLTGRMDIFRNSRLAAVNNITTSAPSGNALNPLTYLDYSPHKTIIIPTDDGSTGYFDPIFYEDERILEVERLLDEADSIINVLLHYKANQAYQLLGGDNNSYDYIVEEVTKPEATQVRDLCNEMLSDANRAYNNFFGPNGAVALLQDVLDNPQIPGPFDYEPEHAENRQQLQDAIDGIEAAQPGLNATLNQQFIPRVRRARNNLNSALRNWDSWWWWRWRRYSYIVQAKRQLKQVIDFVGEIANPFVGDNLAQQIQQAYGLLQGGVSYNAAVQARDLCLQMQQNPQINKETSGFKNLVKGAYSELNNALRYWDSDIREHYLELARQKLGVLDDITTVGS